jgi:hypothetical protein
VVEVGPAGVEEEGMPHTRERGSACALYAREREQRMPSGGSVPSCEIEREREIPLSEEAQTD